MHAVIVSRTLLLKHLKLSPMKNSIHEYIHMLMHFDYSKSTRTVYSNTMGSRISSINIWNCSVPDALYLFNQLFIAIEY